VIGFLASLTLRLRACLVAGHCWPRHGIVGHATVWRWWPETAPYSPPSRHSCHVLHNKQQEQNDRAKAGRTLDVACCGCKPNPPLASQIVIIVFPGRKQKKAARQRELGRASRPSQKPPRPLAMVRQSFPGNKPIGEGGRNNS
jgi:hypothetical protein